MKRFSAALRNGFFITALAAGGAHAQASSPSTPGQTIPGAADPRGTSGPHSGSGSAAGAAQTSPPGPANPVGGTGSGATEPPPSGSGANGNAGYDTNRRSDQNIGWIGIVGVIGLGGLFRRSRNNDRVHDSPRDV